MNTIIIINGPNLNLLGLRKPKIYGNMTLKHLEDELVHYGNDKGCIVECFQSNHEGHIIDKLHSSLESKKYLGCIINAGAYTHYSYAIRDAIEAITIPCIEVHLSDIDKREDFRKISVLTEVCTAQFKGLGINSYKNAIDLLLKKQ